MSLNMTLATKANNILGIMSKFRHKKLANSYDRVDIKPRLWLSSAH